MHIESGEAHAVPSRPQQQVHTPAQAAELSTVRQLGLGVPGGVEIAYRTVELALERLMDDAGGDLDRFGVALAYDLKSAYNNVRRAHMINESMLKYPQMTRFLNLLYGSPGKLIFSANGREIDSFWCYDEIGRAHV